MSQLVQLNFRLFGPRKGQTVNINGHQFINGYYTLAQQSDFIGPCMKVLGFYGAFAKGTPEYEVALAAEEEVEKQAQADAQAEEESNGASEVHEEAKSGEAVQVRSGVQPEGAGLAEEGSDEFSGHVEPEEGNAGADTSGDGHEDTGIPKFEEAKDKRQPTEPASSVNEAVKAALLKLDPTEDSHWVATGSRKGKPKLAAVEQAYGRVGLTISDIENVLPGWDRDRAMEAKLEVA